MAVDLDGTLAEWGPGFNQDVMQIGAPVPRMVTFVKDLLRNGVDVRIMTARVAACGVVNDDGLADSQAFADGQRAMVVAWCREHLGTPLPVTASKDFRMYALFDDRAYTVEANTGRLCGNDGCVSPNRTVAAFYPATT